MGYFTTFLAWYEGQIEQFIVYDSQIFLLSIGKMVNQ